MVSENAKSPGDEQVDDDKHKAGLMRAQGIPAVLDQNEDECVNNLETIAVLICIFSDFTELPAEVYDHACEQTGRHACSIYGVLLSGSTTTPVVYTVYYSQAHIPHF